jgi:uncharacterized protein YprB with RNaseH-like and TPR domain
LSDPLSKLRRMMGDSPPPVPRTVAGSVANLPPGGEWIASGVYLVESVQPLAETFGTFDLSALPCASGRLSPWGAAEPPCFLDLETTGLAGGTGTYAFLAGIGTLEETAVRVRQLFLATPSREAEWLDALDQIVPRDAGFVTYNGRRFDLPLLQTRTILARKGSFRPDSPHLDLLWIARSLWRCSLPSCRLGEVERSILGVQREFEDVPGWQIPSLYADFLRTRDAAPLAGVFLHNRLDILSLAALKAHVGRIVAGEINRGQERLLAGDLWAAKGAWNQAETFWQSAMEDPESRGEALLRLAARAKGEKQWDSAVALWEQSRSACRPSLTVLEELAKAYEHRLHRLDDAMARADEGLRQVESRRAWGGPSWSRERQEWIHRIERLKKKIEAKK